MWGEAWCFFATDDPGAEEWVAAKALAVLAGHATRTAQETGRQAAETGLAVDQRHGADACVRYLRAKEKYLHYETALAAGWPIAAGVIEGACRHLIGDRLDITGARWGLEGAEAVLTLRALLDNGDFDAYWAFHVEQERFRVHQARHRDEYGLIALSNRSLRKSCTHTLFPPAVGMPAYAGRRDWRDRMAGTGDAAGEAAANRELWTRANREYADDHADRAWAAGDITGGDFNVPERQIGGSPTSPSDAARPVQS